MQPGVDGWYKGTILTRGATIDSPPMQHSLRKQPRGPRRSVNGDGRRRSLVKLRKEYKTQDKRTEQSVSPNTRSQLHHGNEKQRIQKYC